MPIVTPHDRPSEGREYYETVVGQRWTELPAKRRRAALFLKALWGGSCSGLGSVTHVTFAALQVLCVMSTMRDRLGTQHYR